jgi:hypothetical protein
MSEKTYRTRSEVLDDPDLTPFHRGQILESLPAEEPAAPQLDDAGLFHLLGLKTRVKAARKELAELVCKEKIATDLIPALAEQVQKLERSLSPDAPESEVLKLMVAQTRRLLAHNAANVALARRQQLREEILPLLSRYSTLLDKQFGAANASSRTFLNGSLENQLRDAFCHIERVLEKGCE